MKDNIIIQFQIDINVIQRKKLNVSINLRNLIYYNLDKKYLIEYLLYIMNR